MMEESACKVNGYRKEKNRQFRERKKTERRNFLYSLSAGTYCREYLMIELVLSQRKH